MKSVVLLKTQKQYKQIRKWRWGDLRVGWTSKRNFLKEVGLTLSLFHIELHQLLKILQL